MINYLMTRSEIIEVAGITTNIFQNSNYSEPKCKDWKHSGRGKASNMYLITLDKLKLLASKSRKRNDQLGFEKGSKPIELRLICGFGTDYKKHYCYINNTIYQYDPEGTLFLDCKGKLSNTEPIQGLDPTIPVSPVVINTIQKDDKKVDKESNDDAELETNLLNAISIISETLKSTDKICINSFTLKSFKYKKSEITISVSKK